MTGRRRCNANGGTKQRSCFAVRVERFIRRDAYVAYVGRRKQPLTFKHGRFIKNRGRGLRGCPPTLHVARLMACMNRNNPRVIVDKAKNLMWFDAFPTIPVSR